LDDRNVAERGEETLHRSVMHIEHETLELLLGDEEEPLAGEFEIIRERKRRWHSAVGRGKGITVKYPRSSRGHCRSASARRRAAPRISEASLDPCVLEFPPITRYLFRDSRQGYLGISAEVETVSWNLTRFTPA
jgi:hypothetical protein